MSGWSSAYFWSWLTCPWPGAWGNRHRSGGRGPGLQVSQAGHVWSPIPAFSPPLSFLCTRPPPSNPSVPATNRPPLFTTTSCLIPLVCWHLRTHLDNVSVFCTSQCGDQLSTFSRLPCPPLSYAQFKFSSSAPLFLEPSLTRSQENLGLFLWSWLSF